MHIDPRKLLLQMFTRAIESAQPAHCLPGHLPAVAPGRLIVIGAGKASAAMARAVEDHWPGALSGLVVTRYGHAVACSRIEIVEASHPVPDRAGLEASKRILDMVRGLTREDTVLCLISGGGSALLALPLDGITLEEKQLMSKVLLRSGASISEINCVRRHLSAIKGGRLATACHPAKVVTLLISDVPGDNPRDIASGPTVADGTTCGDALEILHRYGIAAPESVLRILESGRGESIKPGDPRLAGTDTRVIATPRKALAAAADVALQAGITPCILGDAIEGEAKEVGKILAGIVRSIATHGQPVKPPCVVLSGGETTVTVQGSGTGGRNVEFLLALAVALDGHPNVYALAGDTDGVDGLADVAGAFLAPDSLARTVAKGLRPKTSLADNDGHGFFQALGDSVITGPTLTNVNDFRAILVLDPESAAPQQDGNGAIH